MKSETIKYIVLEQLLTENRVNQAIEAYPCLPPYMIKYLSANDPSGNNKYLNWMCKMIYDYESRSNEGYIGDFTTIWEWLYENYDGQEGDHVKLLASGYGIYRGDEGIITSTVDGAPGRAKNLNPEDAGKYYVHVPGRIATQGRTDVVKNPDGSTREVRVVLVGGNFLQKIDKKKA